jgi:hypothetical protein
MSSREHGKGDSGVVRQRMGVINEVAEKLYAIQEEKCCNVLCRKHSIFCNLSFYAF